MNLNNRCKSELLLFTDSYTHISLDQLIEKFNVSERTIRNDLKLLNKYLSIKSLGEIANEYGKGYILVLDEEGRTRIFNSLNYTNQGNVYLSKNERKKHILLELLNSDTPITSSYLESKLFLSKGTISKELNDLDKWLDKFELRLLSRPNFGYKVEGNETAKRNALLDLVKTNISSDELLNVLSNQITDNNLLLKVDLKLLEESISQLETLLNAKLGDRAIASLFTHLAIAIQRIQLGKTIYLPPEDLEILEKTDAFEIALRFSKMLERKFNIIIPKSETGYITLHILSSQLRNDGNSSITEPSLINASDLLHESDYFDYHEMATELTNHIKSKLDVKFHDEDRLIYDLSIHLKPAVHRCKYKMYLTNPLLNEIKTKYYRIFRILKETMILLKFKYPFEMDDNELSYITLHYAAEIEKGRIRFSSKINVLLVCASGIGTAKMLYSRIKVNFSDINIIDSISYLDYCKQDNHNCDLVISTIRFKDTKNEVIVVSPLLSKKDIEKIDNYLFEFKNTINYDEEGSLENRNEIVQQQLQNMISEKLIEIDVDVCTWEDAIKMSAKSLLEEDYITDEYKDKIISNVNQFGPYIVIAPGIAFAHASNNDGVTKLGLSFTRLKEPVMFNHELNDPVKIIFTLAPIDKKSHLESLKELMKILLDSRKLHRLFNEKSKSELLKILLGRK